MPTKAGPERGGSADRPTPDVETASPAYARRFDGEVGAWFLEVQERLVLEQLRDLPRGSRVLDVGGGHAQLAGPLAGAGFEVTVAGSAPSCAERLRPLREAGRVRFVAGDLLALPVPDDGFDAVLAFRLLAHVDPWRDLLGELCRASRGCVIVDYPSRRSFNVVAGPLFGLKARVEENTRPFRVLPPAEVAGAFAEHGYRVAAHRPEFLLPMALHRALGSRRIAGALERVGRATGLVHRFGSPVVVRAEPV